LSLKNAPVKPNPPANLNALLLAMEDTERLENEIKEKREEMSNTIFENWVQQVGTGEIGKVRAREDSKEEISKRVIYKFVEMANTLAPNKVWSPEEMLQRFESKKFDKNSQSSQLKTFLRAELDKL